MALSPVHSASSSGVQPGSNNNIAVDNKTQGNAYNFKEIAKSLFIGLKQVGDLYKNAAINLHQELQRSTKDFDGLSQAARNAFTKTFGSPSSAKAKEDLALKTNQQKVSAKKIQDIHVKGQTFTHIASGKSKHVFRNVDANAKNVVYKPVQDMSERLLNNRTNEIIDEVVLAKKIQTKIQDPKGLNVPKDAEVNIALDMEVVGGGKGLTVEAPKASGDLESLSKVSMKPLVAINLCNQILNGMTHMHAAGYVHGDIKPENILIYSDGDATTARIADLGKTQSIDPNQTLVYSGNGRYTAPEGGLNQQSEVYGTALTLVRVLESTLPHGPDGLVTVPAKSPILDAKNIDKKEINSAEKNERFGIEKFVTLHKDCVQTERSTLSGKFKMLLREAKVAVGVSTPSPKQQAAVHSYIDAVVDQLAVSDDQKIILRSTLKQMTNNDPATRPTMQQAKDRFEAF